jgi:lipopolysaccharide export system protein LptC
MSRIPLPWVVIALLVIGLVAFWDKSPNELLGEDIVRSANFPQAYMTSIKLREYDAEGNLRSILTTDTAEHFQVNPLRPGPKDYTMLAQHLTAEEGRIDQNGQLITLFTDVRVFQESEQEGLLELLTSELRIKASQQYAETDKAVKMRAQQGHLDTLGMKAYLGEDRIELLSRVRGTYEPQ